MSDQQYIKIETIIKRVFFGTESKHKLIETSPNITKDFKDYLWDDYSIDIDELIKEFKDKDEK